MYKCGESMLQEAASGGQMSKLQKELEQLRTDAGQMKVHLQAATQNQMNAQVPRSCLTVSMPAMRLAMLRDFLPGVLCCFAVVWHLDLLQHSCTIADFMTLCEPNACGGGFLRECFACRKQILSV